MIHEDLIKKKKYPENTGQKFLRHYLLTGMFKILTTPTILISGVRRKFSWGEFIQWCMVSYLVCVVCDVIIWRHIHVFQINVLVKLR